MNRIIWICAIMGSGYSPELVQHQRDPASEPADEPGRPVLRDSQQMLRPPGDRPHAREGPRSEANAHTLRSRKGDGLAGEVDWGHTRKIARRKTVTKRPGTMPKAYCFHIFGNCDRISCNVLHPICFLKPRTNTRATKLSATAKMISFRFRFSAAEGGVL